MKKISIILICLLIIVSILFMSLTLISASSKDLLSDTKIFKSLQSDFECDFSGVKIENYNVSALKDIDANRLKNDVKKLSEFKTRYYYADNHKEVTCYVAKTFKKASGIQPEIIEQYPDDKNIVRNITLTFKGTSTPNNLYIIGAHYDSIVEGENESIEEVSPGADDDASGIAGLFEIARYFKKNPPKSTIILVAFDAEEVEIGEYNIVGSTLLVEKWEEDEILSNIKKVIILDMIGFDDPSDKKLDITLEGKNFSKDLMKSLEDSEKRNNLNLWIERNYNPESADHMSFLDKDIQTVLIIEADFESNSYYHSSDDTPEKLNYDFMKKILQMSIDSFVNLMK